LILGERRMNGGEQIRCAVPKMMTAAITMLALALSACSDDGGDDPDAQPPSTATDGEKSDGDGTSSAAVDDVDDVLRAAVIGTVSTELIGFSYEMQLSDVVVMASEGVQRLGGGWSVTTTTNDPSTPGDDDALDMEARSSDGITWMQYQSWPAPMNGCWLELSSGDVPVGIYGLQPDEVGYVSVLAAMDAREFEDGSGSRITVDIALRNAQMLFQGQMIEQIELPEAGWTTTLIPATAVIDDGRVHSIEVEGPALADAVSRADGTIGAEALAAFRLTDVGVTYGNAVRPAAAGPPPRDLVVTEDKAQQGCH